MQRSENARRECCSSPWILPLFEGANVTPRKRDSAGANLGSLEMVKKPPATAIFWKVGNASRRALRQIDEMQTAHFANVALAPGFHPFSMVRPAADDEIPLSRRHIADLGMVQNPRARATFHSAFSQRSEFPRMRAPISQMLL